MSVRLVFLGTGNAFNADGRLSPALWVRPAGAAPFLVDLGPTAIAAMERCRLDASEVDRVFFTHLHGDHTAGWPFLLLRETFVSRRSRPLEVFGPAGTALQLERLAAGSYPELLQPAKVPFPVEVRELAVARAEGVDAGGGLRFDVVPHEHHANSLGYRFHAGGRRVAVTGDTRWCPGLEELSRGCDLLVVECSSLERQAYAHVSLEELREGASRLGAARVAIVHLTDDVAHALDERPITGVFAAADGLELEV
ncbi:MAG: MBL fold metallo-hydrolase [Planctomycetota bacterium]